MAELAAAPLVRGSFSRDCGSNVGERKMLSIISFVHSDAFEGDR
jgi:hypothetical protein